MRSKLIWNIFFLIQKFEYYIFDTILHLSNIHKNIFWLYLHPCVTEQVKDLPTMLFAWPQFPHPTLILHCSLELLRWSRIAVGDASLLFGSMHLKLTNFLIMHLHTHIHTYTCINNKKKVKSRYFEKIKSLIT